MYERGAMLSATDVYGNVIKVTSYDMLGNTTQVSEGCDVFTYAYGSVGGNAERLTSVTLARNGHVIAQAQYTYYAANDPSDNGNGGDLEQVRVFTSASSTSPLQEVDGSYYHYYVTGPDDLEDAVTGPAYARLVAAVFGANATAAAPAAGSSASLNSADVSNYADQFTYGGQNRVNWQGIVGTGASSLQNPLAIGYLSYSYGDNGRSRGVGINAWMQVTTITLPSGATQSVYTNYAGEPMLSALTDSGDTVNYNLNGDIWNTYFAYDPQGRLLLTAEPSAVTQQPDSAQPDLGGVTAVVSSNQGLVKGTDYYGPYDATPGYVEDTYVEQGQQASTKALQEYYQYVTLSGNGVSIQAVADERVFSAATSNVNDSSARDTYFHYANNSLPVMTETEDLPVVGFSQNDRSGTGKIVTDYDAFGGVQSVTDADGYTTNYRYDYGGLGTGVLIKTVQGLDTAQSQTITTSSVPDPWAGPSRPPTAT